MPDLATIAAFLDPNHREWASYLAAFGETRLRSRPKPKDDDAARREAVELVRLMGEAGLYAPLAEMDYRGAALARETIAVASPLACRPDRSSSSARLEVVERAQPENPENKNCLAVVGINRAIVAGI